MSEELNKVVEKLTMTTEKISNTLSDLVSQKSLSTKESTKNTMPSKTELVGHKWTIEHYQDQKEVIELKETEHKHAVYIYRCKNVTISIPSKVTAVTLDSCEGVGFLVETVIASIDIISSKKLQCQILDLCPTITVDNTTGLTLYFSEACIDKTRVFTSKSSEMNILCKTATMKEDDDMLELPIPEQFETIVKKDGTLHTEAVVHI